MCRIPPPPPTPPQPPPHPPTLHASLQRVSCLRPTRRPAWPAPPAAASAPSLVPPPTRCAWLAAGGKGGAKCWACLLPLPSRADSAARTVGRKEACTRSGAPGDGRRAGSRHAPHSAVPVLQVTKCNSCAAGFLAVREQGKIKQCLDCGVPSEWLGLPAPACSQGAGPAGSHAGRCSTRVTLHACGARGVGCCVWCTSPRLSFYLYLTLPPTGPGTARSCAHRQ